MEDLGSRPHNHVTLKASDRTDDVQENTWSTRANEVGKGTNSERKIECASAFFSRARRFEKLTRRIGCKKKFGMGDEIVKESRSLEVELVRSKKRFVRWKEWKQQDSGQIWKEVCDVSKEDVLDKDEDEQGERLRYRERDELMQWLRQRSRHQEHGKKMVEACLQRARST